MAKMSDQMLIAILRSDHTSQYKFMVWKHPCAANHTVWLGSERDNSVRYEELHSLQYVPLLFSSVQSYYCRSAAEKNAWWVDHRDVSLQRAWFLFPQSLILFAVKHEHIYTHTSYVVGANPHVWPNAIQEWARNCKGFQKWYRVPLL